MKRKNRSLQINGCVLLGSVLSLLGSFSNVARAQTQTVPSFCTLDGKKTWYFSLGRAVFRIPIFKDFSPNIIVRHSGGDRFVPPDPRAPSGCENNPQQIAAVWLINWPQLQRPSDAPDLPDIVYELNLGFGRLTDQDAGTTKSKPCGIAIKNYLKIFDDGTTYCTNMPEGLSTLSGSFALNWRPYSLYWRFFVAKKTYETALGEQLSVFGSPFGGVSASYYLAPQVVIHYQWIMPLHEITVDPDYVIEADKLIEKSLNSYEIADYPWQS